MGEHDAGGHVTWRDLEQMGVVRYREIDRRLKDMERSIDLARQAVDEAREIARAGVLAHDVEKNNLLGQIAAERATYATRVEMAAALEAVSLEVHGLIDKEVAALRSIISSLGSTVSSSGESIGELEVSDSKRAGRELGIWGAIVTVAAVLFSILGNVLLKVLFD